MKTETVNIDHYLDLHNAIDNYIDKSSETDTSFFIFYNEESNGLSIGMGGDEETICAILCNENNWVNIQHKQGFENQDAMQKVVLSAALNILRVKPSFRLRFKKLIDELK